MGYRIGGYTRRRERGIQKEKGERDTKGEGRGVMKQSEKIKK